MITKHGYEKINDLQIMDQKADSNFAVNVRNFFIRNYHKLVQ